MTKHRFGATLCAALGLLTLLALPHLSRATEITIGTGTGDWVLPLSTGYHDTRTQSIYLASEIGMAGQITSLALDVTTIPGQVMNNFTLRLKHTALSTYSTASWEGPASGWTTVYQANQSITATGWITFAFTTPFEYNGADNLMLDLSFNNSSASTTGRARYTDQAVNRTLYYRTNSDYGDPLTWSGASNPAPSLHAFRSNIRIEIYNLPDTDGDGLYDWWENQYSCMMADTVDNLADNEPDGLDNDGEYGAGTNPCLSDTDVDGLSDGDEVNFYVTNPKDPDTDDDGLTDGQEVNTYLTNPLDPDTDGGGENDGSEIGAGHNPLNGSDDIYLITIGTGTDSWCLPLCTSYHDARTQSIYLASEIGGVRLITSLGLDVSAIPGLMNNFTIRLKHTALNSYSTASWEGSGWTVVYQANEIITSPGWWTFTFATPFLYNGEDNLLVDLSFNNSSTSSTGSFCYTYLSMSRIMYYLTNSAYGDPLAWSGTSNPAPSLLFYRPNIRLELANPPDTDGDGLYDFWENQYSCMMADTVDNLADYEPDGLDNDGEYWAYANPCLADTDGDGLSDGDEVNGYGTNPISQDTDLDGMPDGWEVAQGFNPLVNDASQDPDSDGLSNLGEYNAGTNPHDSDTDDDTMTDGYEVQNSLSPFIDDATGDLDGDGLTNLQEFALGTKANDADTDDDGLTDSEEVNTFSTDPLNPDTDGDGQDDRNELNQGSNPLDNNVFPRLVRLESEVRLTPASGSDQKPGLAWTGSEFALAWQSGPDTQYDIYFQRLGPDSAPIGPATDIYGNYYPSLAWTGSEFGLMSWAGTDIKFQRLSASGSPLEPSLSVSNGYEPSVAWTGSEFGLAFIRGWPTEVYFIRISPGGVKIGADLQITYNGFWGRHPQLVWTGSEFGLSWNDFEEMFSTNDLWFTRISSLGLKIGPDLYVPYPRAKGSDSSLCWTGSEYGISWTDTRDGDSEIYFARISSQGAKLGQDLRVTYDSADSLNSSLAFSGSEFGLAWQESRDGNLEIYFTMLSDFGLKLFPDFRVSFAPGESQEPALIWTGSQFGLAWEDARNGTSELYFSRIAEDTDGDGLLAWEETAAGTNPHDWDTDDDGMADGWEETFSACMAPLSPDSPAGDYDSDGLANFSEYLGSTNPCFSDTDNDGLTDSEEIGIYLTDPLVPDTDDDGLTDGEEALIYLTNPLIADTDGDGVNDGNEVTGGANPLDPRVTPSIRKIGSDLRVTSEPSTSRDPSLTWTGSEFGVCWEDNREGHLEIYFARVSAAGEKISEDLRVTVEAFASRNPSLTWTGLEFGVSWDGNDGINFARLSAEGEKIGEDLRVSAAGPSYNPSLTWTGSEFGVSWECWECWEWPEIHSDIYFARVSAAGVKIGSDLQVTFMPSETTNPSLTWTGSEFGVSWMDWWAGSLYFARVSAAGAKIGANPLVTSSITVYPSLTWTGSEFGVICADYFYEYIHFARVSAAGAKIGPDLLLAVDVAGIWSPSLTWTGSEFGVSWHDRRDGNWEIYFSRISAAGAKTGPDLRVTFQASDSWGPPSLTWSGSEFGVSWYDHRDGNDEIYFARIGLDPDGDGLGIAEEALAGTNASDWDTDDDGLSDGEEVHLYYTNPLSADSDGDGLSDSAEVITYHTNPLASDTDLDGISDSAEVAAGLNPLLWDTDGDALPDGYEVAHLASSPPLNALSPLDGNGNFDSDSNSNRNEYWNGSDPWTANLVGGVGCFYWAEAGMGDGIVSPGDVIELKKVITGGRGNYRGVIPGNGETQELDMDGYISPNDLIILQKIIVQTATPALGSRPAALEVLEAPPASMAVGYTCHLAVGVKNEAGSYTPGFGVVFELVAGQSTGTATLLGGEGAATPGARYDVSGPIASSGRSRIALRIDSPGTVTVRARVPECGTPGVGRSSPELILDPAAVIHGQ